MKNLYNTRLSYHLKHMMKYMRYVLNDHFVLVCIFLFGGFGFYYSQILKQLPKNFFWSRIIVLVVWLLMLQVGRLVTLAKAADEVFILPKEKKMTDYLKKACQYSLIFPFILYIFGCGIMLPLLVVSTKLTFDTFFYFLVMFICLKIGHLFLQEYGLYQISSFHYRIWWSLWFIISTIAIFLSLYLFPYIGNLLAFLQIFIFYFLLKKTQNQVLLDWEKMIQKEKNRIYRIYQFIHLFTDVPEVTSSIKRRKVFDPFLNQVKQKSKNTYLYLYMHSFIRRSAYSGLFIRLVIVGMILLFFIQEFWFALGVSLLFIYLIGFQLIPIYTQFDYMVMVQWYPVPLEKKKKAVNQLITGLLLIAVILFGICLLVALANKLEACFIFGLLIVEVLIFSKWYVAYRLKKIND